MILSAGIIRGRQGLCIPLEDSTMVSANPAVGRVTRAHFQAAIRDRRGARLARQSHNCCKTSDTARGLSWRLNIMASLLRNRTGAIRSNSRHEANRGGKAN